ncbi:recombinase family protein [Rhodoblastus acidophilus]|nr:recombinase family protein [Rhodoblastus acidophilus]PPQ35546.1 recombinase family protein [Rhodoblastus acidophilus]RAI18886.1 recombinase family protein [Rhodoblastus acidophilus]
MTTPASRRAAIYARFSTDFQSDQSVEDQFAICRALAHREGFSIVQTYSDRAKSGASILGRDGVQALIEDAKAAKFDVLIVEALDRLSRDMADLALIFRDFQFRGIEIRAVHDGVADTVTIGLRGLVGQLFREDGAKKVRRGMAGVIRDGRYAGGRAYGYAPTPGEPGKLRIVEEEAQIVRRIFAEYAEGRAPRDIAAGLNRDNIAPPRGAAWNASTINGNRERGHGIIQNPIYGGEIVWNRVRMVKDPSTGKRISRPNPESEWQRAPAPHLQIIDPDTRAAAIARKGAHAPAPRGPRRYTRSILSGLLKCGRCGSGMVKHDNSAGRPRIRCSRVAESGCCDNKRRYYLDAIEQGVIAELRAQLDQPELLAEFIQTYHEERRRLAGTAARGRIDKEKRLADIRRQLVRIADMLAEGAAAFDVMRGKMEQLDQERRELEAALAAQAESESVVTLHPQAVARFRQMLEALATEMSAENPLAHAAFRELVERIIVHPTPTGQEQRVEIVGRLAALLDLKGLGRPAAAVGGFLVAEEGLEPPTQGL